MGSSRNKQSLTSFLSLETVVTCLLVFCCTIQPFQAEVLTPPYFNLAAGRKITASATCGDKDPELYCKLVGANADTEDAVNPYIVIQGQVCDICDINKEGKAHPPEYAVDGSDRWWQSPPLSRGMTLNEVNLTIDLGQEFHVAYVFITMANSPRPGVWVLERSIDNGKTYSPWQYFADSPAECERFFNVDGDVTPVSDDDVICSTQFSKVVPLEGGEIIVPLLTNRPHSNDFFSSTILQEWTRATNVRLRLLRTKTLLGHLMSVARQDHTVTRRYYYSIKDISIGGRCRCNGHADLCAADPYDESRLLCECKHNTVGPQCEQCHPSYVQKAWRPSTNSTPFVCERCNCHGHTQECVYNATVDANHESMDLNGNYEGGGVCQNCQHNTEGINCDKCQAGFYRPYDAPLDAIDVCQPCQCDPDKHTGNCAEGSGKCECSPEFLSPDCDRCSPGYYDYPNCKPCDCHQAGTAGDVCEVGGGECPCKRNFTGKNCDQCAEGFYNFPECLPCNCESPGSEGSTCDKTSGACVCKNNFGGRNCDSCADGYFRYPECSYCYCDNHGTTEGVCDKSNGSCLCREGYGGDQCDQCLPSFYGHPECKQCNCSSVGSATTVCDSTGKCPCLHNFSGRTCDQCSPGYYKFPECLACECHDEGSMGVSCDDEGKCHCKSNFDGLRCDQCREGFYIFPRCEECNCDPSGVVETFSGCGNSPPGELCECKPRVQGRICDNCKPLFWNLQQANPQGCDDCDCHPPGVIGGILVCESKTGQCPCKNNIQSRRCDQCRDGYFNLTDQNVMGCQGCNCDLGGSSSIYCDKYDGQCDCRNAITGRACDMPLTTYYFPTLYQFQHEAEDGTTINGGPVRFSYNEAQFPDYSWRGYAVYSQLQPQTNHEVYIEKPSVYHIVLRYINPETTTVIGEVVATPDNPAESEMRSKFRLEPTGFNSSFYTVLQPGNYPAPFVLNPGRWHIAIKSESPLFVDYFVLLPQAYYEASVLQRKVADPCLFNITDGSKVHYHPEPCVRFKYPNLNKYDKVLGSQPVSGSVRSSVSPDSVPATSPDHSGHHIHQTLADNLAFVSPQQKAVEFDLPITKAGRYALVVEYITPAQGDPIEINVEAPSKKGANKGRAVLHECLHTTPCRAVLSTDSGEVSVFRFDQNQIRVKVNAADDISNDASIVAISAVPMGKWSPDFIRPQQHCVVADGSCVNLAFEQPPDSIKVEAESSGGEGPPADIFELEPVRRVVNLTSENRTINVPGTVTQPGYYSFVVHYFQPEHPDFSMDVVVKNGHHQEGRIPIVHCPSVEGCRSLVAQDDRNTRFYIEDDYELQIKSPKDVSIDYILVTPYADMREMNSYLNVAPLDQTSKFIAECGKNHLYVPKNSSDFCRKAVFSLATEYNNGALRCQCEPEGSTNFVCDPYGGQCSCKPNIIGRRCERCKTGFYGYPACKPCDCPSTALCDADTGECICPPRVTGAQCDKCEPFTYGFDPLIGCEECGCSPTGVNRGNLQCDLNTGKCDCRPNVVGRSCESCAAGFWAFPLCQLCGCDFRGTTEGICDPGNSDCYCKPNVEGRLCDKCRPDSFNLDQENPFGCTKCFCFGKTKTCSSSHLHWSYVDAEGSQLSSVVFDIAHLGVVREIPRDDDQSFDDSLISLPEERLIEANDSYVQYIKVNLHSNHLASYGGHLRYVLELEPDLSETGPTSLTFQGAPDVILEGGELAPSSNVVFFAHYLENDVSKSTKIDNDVALIEEKFKVQSPYRGGGLATPNRDQMMILLKELRAIYIRTTYRKRTRSAKLTLFSLQVADEHPSVFSQERATSVEKCQCPPSYRGLSCEECADGYFRYSGGQFGGSCIPCQCNGHADTCDPVSGVCHHCAHNTTGDHCEMCAVGYHGDATAGTPVDCIICACPLPDPKNNFATSCEISSEKTSCNCRPGYTGQWCQRCDAGYYGEPEMPGDNCKPCECSGNIDPTNPLSCNHVNGTCLLCLNNTGGERCASCAPWHYGDAIGDKYCQPCACDKCGTDVCDMANGACRCLPNVEGELCDKCSPDHWGLSECDGRGCRPCECGVASESTSCADDNGQCQCKPGVTGINCDRCIPGFWNYSENGCESCRCNQEYARGSTCDPGTGQCSCLPGVIGEKCDRCRPRWVLIEGQGCRECESCHHQLLNTTDEMENTLQPVKQEFDNVAVGYFTTQKLAYFNETAAKFEPEVRMLDHSQINLKPFKDQVDAATMEHKSAKKRADVSSDSLREKAKASAKIRDKSEKIEKSVRDTVSKTQTAVYEVKDLVGRLLNDVKFTAPQTEAALAEARQTVDDMVSVRFNTDDAMEEKKSAEKTMREINEYVEPVTEITARIAGSNAKIAIIKDKLSDLRNQSDHSRKVTQKANEVIKQIKDDKYHSKAKLLEDQVATMKANKDSALVRNSEVPLLLTDLENALSGLSPISSRVEELISPLKSTVESLDEVLRDNTDTVMKSQEHVRKLKRDADELETLLNSTLQSSEQSVNAATAYMKIVEAIDEARSDAERATGNVKAAAKLISDVQSQAKSAVEPSQNLLTTAKEKVRTVDETLKIPLKDAKILMEEIERTKNDTEATLAVIDRDLDKITFPRDAQDIDSTTGQSSEAIENAADAIGRVDDILIKIQNESIKARKLPVTIKDLNGGVTFSDGRLRAAMDSVPLSKAIAGNLDEQKPTMDSKKDELRAKLNELRAKISTAREQANRVPVAMRFAEASSLTAANPPSIESQQYDSKVSFYFKTQEEDGLLLYIDGDSTKRNEGKDFMAVEIQRGYPVLSINLGSTTEEIRSGKYAADDKWHKATVDRSGKHVKFTITEEDQSGNVQNYESDGYISGPKALFNIDQNNSRIYVGGLPDSVLDAPVRHTSYVGDMEDLTIGGEKVGLWNFKDANNVNATKQRDRFTDLKSREGLRFLGNGFAKLDRSRKPFRERSSIRLRFRTRANDGIIFMVSKGDSFLSLELANGAVVYRFDLGNGNAKIETPQKFNDGMWHQLDAVRHGKQGRLTVDSHSGGTLESPGDNQDLIVDEFMYFGGHDGPHEYPEVTQTAFEGCIDTVYVNDETVDLTQALVTQRTTTGCPSLQSDESIVNLYGTGYLEVPPGSTTSPQRVGEEEFELNFRLRSNSTSGLVFYGSDADRSSELILWLDNNDLKVEANPEGVTLTVDKVGDGKWHVVTVIKSRTMLSVHVDDKNDHSESINGAPLYLAGPGSLRYFGGARDDLVTRAGTSLANMGLEGCISDVHMNGEKVNIGTSRLNKVHVSSSCTLGEPRAMSPGSSFIEPPPEETGPTSAPEREEEPTTLATPAATRAPRIKPTPPKPFEKCALPYRTLRDEPSDDEVFMEDGVRFGKFKKISRMEFLTTETDSSKSIYSIEFKTARPDGLIFFRSDFMKTDFVALFMKNGILHFGFDSGSGSVYLNSTRALNDSRWHTVAFSREKQQGVLVIDEEEHARGSSTGSTNEINAGKTLFIGGLPPEGWNKRHTLRKLMSIDSAFKGCLRNFMIRGGRPGQPTKVESVEPCSDDVEDGLFFYPNGGHLKLLDSFVVGNTIKISMQIKPRSTSGVILAVHGSKDYLVLQMINGTVKFTVNNGDGPFASSFLKGEYDLCDGNWHSILATKTKNVVTLAIDQQHAMVGMGALKSLSTNTDREIYLGGSGDYTLPGIETSEQFVGCIKDFVLERGQGKRKHFKLSFESVSGQVALHSCPTD